MMLARTLFAIVMVALFGFTGVRVGALLPLEPQVIPAPSVSQAPLENAEEEIALSDDDQSAMARLDQRLLNNADDFEASLLKGLLLFQAGALDEAIIEIRQLTLRAPKFQLAHLVLGDLLIARFSPLNQIGASALQDHDRSMQQRVEQLQSEARARLLGYLSLNDERRVPAALMSLSGNTTHVLLVDKSKNRLYIYKNAGPGLPPQPVEDFYIVLGKKTGDKQREGDLRTPNGVYFVTSYLPDEKLPPLYGSGAFPFNYPNELDRRLRKTGSGIWLHGTDKSLYSRPPLDSEGCVVLTNDEFSRIRRYVDIGRTSVIISEQLDWISTRQWLDRNIELQAVLETWRQSWENTDIDAYLAMYSSEFWAQGHNSQSWERYKTQVFQGKRFQKIDLSDISLFAYPRKDSSQPMVVANFVQHYRSNNFNGDMRKRLYMVKETDSWRILYEGRQ